MSRHITDTLQALLPMITSSSKWTLKAMLQSNSTIVTKEFIVDRGFPKGWEIYCILPCSNDKYHFQVTLGTTRKNLEKLLPYEGDHAIRLSALGEIANVISSLLTAEDVFMEAFNHMRASTPFFSEGDYTEKPDWCVHGRIAVDDCEFFLNFSLREAENPSEDIQFGAAAEPQSSETEENSLASNRHKRKS